MRFNKWRLSLCVSLSMGSYTSFKDFQDEPKWTVLRFHFLIDVVSFKHQFEPGIVEKVVENSS